MKVQPNVGNHTMHSSKHWSLLCCSKQEGAEKFNAGHATHVNNSHTIQNGVKTAQQKGKMKILSRLLQLSRDSSVAEGNNVDGSVKNSKQCSYTIYFECLRSLWIKGTCQIRETWKSALPITDTHEEAPLARLKKLSKRRFPRVLFKNEFCCPTQYGLLKDPPSSLASASQENQRCNFWGIGED